MSNLTVYKASAGSGKTFTLAVEYIKLLIADPYSYRRILAVTFTNKATDEMKTRILSQLYGIWKQLPDSQGYSEKVCSQLQVTPEYAAAQAGIALNNLLHNYSYFRIETIDSFFQSILRNLARELDLTSNLRIDLGDHQVEEHAVDQLIENLNATDAVLKWIIDYIKEKITDDKSWNVIYEIKQFGKTIFKDKYKDSSKQLGTFMANKGAYENYVANIKKMKEASKNKMADYGNTFFNIIGRNGFTIDDFSYGKSGVCGFFIKLQNGIFDSSSEGKRVADCLTDPDKWIKSKHKYAASIKSLVISELIPLLAKATTERKKMWMIHKSAEITLRHLNQMRLLNVIEKKVRELNNDANRFLLSDTQHLLHSLIDGNDSTFIYEKTGTAIKHIMIDEFQDTSTIQWQNFKVLLLDSMSQAESCNLIVGDVKQSIYRWREGDWKLLNNIKEEFKAQQSMVKIDSLDTNYRSQGNIVSFNNALFRVLTENDTNSYITTAYADVKQNTPNGKEQKGYVKMLLLPANNYRETTMQEIKSFIEALLDKGVKQRDIAILLRRNKTISEVAAWLKTEMSHRNINVVSDEAFKLEASIGAGIIASALHLLVHPDDNLEKAKLAKTYNRYIAAGTNGSINAALDHADMLDSMLPVEFTANMTELKRMPLYELCQHLYRIFHVDSLKGESAYMATFNDKLMNFICDRSADISSFINEWNENICNTSIQGTDVDGIRLLSIHKSKGLEFDNVIIPFLDWKMERTQDNTLLCTTTANVFKDMPLIPVDYSSQLKDTIYAQSYLEENLQNAVDHMNLLYVAVTRASANMLIIGKKGAAGTRSRILEDKMKDIAADPVLKSGNAVFSDGDIMSLEFGDIFIKQEERKEESNNVFLKHPVNLPVSISATKANVEFRQSNESKRFTDNDEPADNRSGYIKIGLVMHDVLSKIKTTRDIPAALAKLEQDGVLYDEVNTSERMKSMLEKRFKKHQVAEWFSDSWEVINENTILWIDKETGKSVQQRPDRVMIRDGKAVVVDFKFGNPKEKYKTQVAKYMEQLSLMGYKDVEGYLWYVYSNDIEKVQIT